MTNLTGWMLIPAENLLILAGNGVGGEGAGSESAPPKVLIC